MTFTPEMRSALCSVIDDLRKQSDEGVFTHAENLHLTLAFIGEADRSKLPDIEKAISAASGRRFDISLCGSGHFGELWWAGINGAPPLSAFAKRIRAELIGRGFDIDTKPFSPHITLARQLKFSAPLKIEVPEVSMTVRKVSLMKSERVSGRLTYTEIFSHELNV